MAKQHPEPYRRQDKGKIFYFTFVDENGKRRVKSTGTSTKKDAREFIRDFIDRQESGTARRFRDYAAPFFIAGKCPREARLRPERRNYGTTHMQQSRDWLERYVLTDPVFPELPLNDIRRRDVLDLRSRLVVRLGDKLNSAGKALAAATTILSEAEYREDIATNPGRGISKPQYDGRQRGSFTASEVRLILANLADLCATDKASVPERGRRPQMEAFFAVLFLAGLRLGEARALRWDDLDLEAGRFSVVRAVKDRADTIGRPKWEKVREGLVLPGLLSDRLRRWRDALSQMTSYDSLGLVFPAADGSPVSTTVVRKAWYRLITHAEAHPAVKLAGGDRWLTPHSCRHSLNTHLLAARVPPLDVQQFLGWQSEAGKALTRVQAGYTDLRLLDTASVASAIDVMYETDTPERLNSIGLA
jgi:integrase